MRTKDYSKYFSGELLYGDDFSIDEIKVWYQKEKEAYANTYGFKENNNVYEYKNITDFYGYNHLPVKKFDNVLGFGSAWGTEFFSIIDRIKNLTILETSTQTRSEKIGNINPKYFIPDPSGIINFPDNSFDLITCFGVLHHIPNVTFVLSEFYRVLSPGGYLLIREPVRSMGDWRTQREGATPNERGIPHIFFDKTLNKAGFNVIKKDYLHTCRGFFVKLFGKTFVEKKIYVYLDKYLSKVLVFNIHYHPASFIQKLAPSIVFYIIKK